MGVRFETYKLRMQSESEIKRIESEIADHEAYIAANGDAHATPLGMLRTAVAVMKVNLSDLKRNHARFVESGRKRYGQNHTRSTK